MISNETKCKLLKELEKSGNVFFSCMKVGIDRTTYYRWRKIDASFRKKADAAFRVGIENLCDIAEHALMMNVKDKKMDAIKYLLSRNSPRYKQQRNTSRVVIEHISGSKAESPKDITFEDLLMQAAENELRTKER